MTDLGSLVRKTAVGIWLDAGVLGSRTHLVPGFVASNIRHLGASYGLISRMTYYEDCFANGSPAERAFRSELGNAGFNVLHRPRLGKGVEVPNAALRDDLLDFIKQKQPGPRTVIVATMNGSLAPTLKALAGDSHVSTIVIAPESMRDAYRKPIVFAPLDNLLQTSVSSIGAPGERPVLDLEAFFAARPAEPDQPLQAKFNLSEWFPGGPKAKEKVKSKSLADASQAAGRTPSVVLGNKKPTIEVKPVAVDKAKTSKAQLDDRKVDKDKPSK